MSVVRVSLPYLEIAAHHNLFLLQLKKYISVRLDFSFGKKNPFLHHLALKPQTLIFFVKPNDLDVKNMYFFLTGLSDYGENYGME